MTPQLAPERNTPPDGVANLTKLETQFRKQMFEPGAPEHVAEQSVRADARMVARLKCPSCGRRRLEYFPWHRGPKYRVLAGCTGCQSAEEV
jgi:hypothetical protein